MSIRVHNTIPISIQATLFRSIAYEAEGCIHSRRLCTFRVVAFALDILDCRVLIFTRLFTGFTRLVTNVIKFRIVVAWVVVVGKRGTSTPVICAIAPG